MSELIIWGLPEGETDRLQEQVLSSHCKTARDIEKVKRAASADGWHSFRIVRLDLSAPPDFVSVVLGKERL